jgi:hypothetical protein
MQRDLFVTALGLPAGARLDRRVPKKLLLEQGAPTAADKRQIADGIEALVWIAALKPNTVGIPAFKDEQREYLEIAVLTAVLRSGVKALRLTELIHRAIPYPVVLLTEQDDTMSLSLAHKRWSKGEAGEIVIEEVHRTAPFRPETPTASEAAFLSSIALSALPNRNLYTLYEDWIDRVIALEAARVSGIYQPPETAERAAVLRETIAAYTTLERELVTLRTRAKREKQVSRRVELNMVIKELRSQQKAMKEDFEMRGDGR